MTYQLNQRELIIDLASGDYQINPILHRINGVHIIGPVDYGWARYTQALEQGPADKCDTLTWGGGPLAGSRIPGTRRLVFCGYSPQWQGFYVSSLGGAAYTMHRIGVDFVTLQGQAPQDSVLILNHQAGQIRVRLEPVNPDLLWSGYGGPDGERLYGYYALQQAVLDRYGKEYDEDWVRVFATGPASRLTNQGIIGSNPIRKGRLTPVEDWAGRGGLGSQLVQHHRIAACIFGGDWEDPDLKDSKEIDGYFQHYYGEKMIKVDLGATEKYRYAPGFQTGGTFGVNMHTSGDNLLSFNYTSIYESEASRLEQNDHFICDHYLQQFNEEIIKPKSFAHCGEPCSVACKKVDRIYKKDFEPYQALGPLVGVFDQRAAEELNHFVDAMGLDAIQAGGTVAWIMELVHAGLVPPEDLGLPPASQMRFQFASNPEQFDLVAGSKINAEYAQKVVECMLFSPQGEPLRRGVRAAAHEFDRRYGFTHPGERCIDRAVFTSHGETGCMTPNQYWVPGMVSPMPMMGKYFVYYGLDYHPPRELGRLCVERMVYELFSENTGVCRFHRKWAETIVDEIISAHYHFPVDYKAHQFTLARQVYVQEGPASVFWESSRTVDFVWQYLEKWERHGLKDESLHQWTAAFRADPQQAARLYWEELRAGIEAAFALGPEAIPDQVAPFQAARMDVMNKNQ